MTNLSEEDKKVCERLRLIREELGLTQDAFGKQLDITGGGGITKSGVCAMENMRRGVSKNIENALYTVFHVNEEYLKHGKKPMFIEVEKKKELETLLTGLYMRENTIKKEIIFRLCKLPEVYFEDFHTLLDKLKSERLGTEDLIEIFKLLNKI